MYYIRYDAETGKGLSYVSEFIAESSNRQNITRMVHIFFNLRTETPDVNIHGTVGNERFVSPNMINNLISGIHAAGITGQKEKEFEFCRTERDGLSVNRNMTGNIIDFQPLIVELLLVSKFFFILQAP